MDKLSIIELLDYILESISIIRRRFENIKSCDDFMNSDDGIDRLDAISMRLQSIGEALKNIYKADKELLEKVKSASYWSQIIKLREIISHHYIDIDSEIIFDICENELNELEESINKTKIVVTKIS
ncbi:MAG: DUF86 domain-containing protein [Sulfurimonas sp.]|uniref:HepT-like ribonuclease domain-containing protein n=1 Tax=Sulfurimonas sp. TaxID=2022749 RepID=UPI00262F42D0|nr:HepT-like ribonuclease domain-containing protein [Sulfurimonas sp.]MDD5371876.1 DUF86 domain-containing protein [Sulfurimonas sp.]